MAVEVIDHSGLDDPSGPIADLVEAVLDAEGVAGGVVIAFVDEQAMTDLNSRYRGVGEPTDVLSFRYSEDEAEWPGHPQVRRMLGDESVRAGAALDLGEIVICPDVVRGYAEDEGRGARIQLAWTLVHGVLHLVGYDHEQDEGGMREREQVLLERFSRLVGKVPSPRPAAEITE